MKEKTLPEFLKPFEEELEKIKKECIQIEAIPLNEENILEDPLELKQSKFLGLPFFPKSREYPTDTDGNPMILLAQLVFSEIPHLDNFPKDGILQVYLPLDNSWYENDCEVIYITEDELKEDVITDFSFLFEDEYGLDGYGFPIPIIHKLKFEKVVDPGTITFIEKNFDFNGSNYWSFHNSLNKQDQERLLNYFYTSGHKIGGYPSYVQTDPGHDDIQLLEITSEGEIMFGDDGVAHIFISKDNLLSLKLNKAYFYSDCG